MAQLRDAETSEIVAEGTVADLLMVADHMGDKVMWDDVPYVFDDPVLQEGPGRIAVDFDAVRKQNAEKLGYLKGEELVTEKKRRAAIVRQVSAIDAVIVSAQKAAADTLEHITIG